MSSRTYTIKQIREMIAEKQDEMNAYKHSGCAEGFAKVYEWLQEIEDSEGDNVKDDYEYYDVMFELNG